MAWTANDYLMHHGILGMRWGKKNGPPYPLDPSDHSASERKAGWRKSLDKGSGDEKTGKEKRGKEPDTEGASKRKGLSDKQKRLLKVGATAAVSGLAIWGAYKLGKLPELDKLTSMGKNVINGLDLKKTVNDIEKFYSKSETASESGAVKHALDAFDKQKTISEINQGRTLRKLPEDETPHNMQDLFGDMTDANPLHKPEDLSNTCTNVFLAAAARLQGFNVLPGWQRDDEGVFTGNKLSELFEEVFEKQHDAMNNTLCKDASGQFFKNQEDVERSIRSRLKNPPEGSYGCFSATFDLGTKFPHAVTWRIENGKMLFGDGINGLNTELYFSNIDPNERVYFFRADNNPMKIDALRKYLIFA